MSWHQRLAFNFGRTHVFAGKYHPNVVPEAASKFCLLASFAGGPAVAFTTIYLRNLRMDQISKSVFTLQAFAAQSNACG
jgi:hypothetical protein